MTHETPPFDAVLIANRGEISVRIGQACKELGIEAVAVYSDTDEDAKHVRLADRASHVGPSVARKSYLDFDALLGAAREADVDAIHPGYGFLAENESFARAVEESEFTWVGPPSDVIARFGEKTGARKLMKRAGVPIVPGTTEPIEDPDEVRAFGEEHGYPIAIKADGGGGGRGIRAVHRPEEIETALEDARREGQEYFGNPDVYIERYIEDPRHVEVQVLADEHGTVRHLGERDCSVQRRHQKLIEETPSPALDEETREALWEAAVRGAAESDYVNAGTVEFLYENGTFYFLEVNTRIQVEHTITEAVTGIDLVKWQLRIAAGEEVDFGQDEVRSRGHAMEFRINAEDPAADFSPMPGELTTYRPPRGIGVRIDDGVDQGDRISPFYDSMFAKFVVWGTDREEARRRGLRAIDEAEIEGIPTTLPFHERVLADRTFVDAEHTTRYVDEDADLDFE